MNERLEALSGLREPVCVHGVRVAQTQCKVCMNDELIAIRSKLDEALAVVSAQALDEGLWFQAQTAPEAYLQQELRALHEAIEGKTGDYEATLRDCCEWHKDGGDLEYPCNRR